MINEDGQHLIDRWRIAGRIPGWRISFYVFLPCFAAFAQFRGTICDILATGFKDNASDLASALEISGTFQLFEASGFRETGVGPRQQRGEGR
jgi:hypothetical protein